MDNTVAMFAGTAESNTRPEVADKLAAIDSTVRTWLTAMDAIGYVFLDQQQADIALEEVTASRRVVRLSNPDTRVTKKVFSVCVEHAVGAPPSSMAYALVPNASEQQLRSYVDGPVSVLVNTTQVQAVKHTGLGLVAVNVFAEGRHLTERLSIDGPASVIMHTTRDGVTSIAVSDPTMQRDTITLTVHGRTMRGLSADDGVRVTPVPGGTQIDVTTRHAYGRSFTATLRQ